tara:strand:- start:1922 stop:2116 length:195 start_codon:yes stop_codon:yes gene_type:complete
MNLTNKQYNMDKSIHDELRNLRKEMARRIKWQELEITRLTNELKKQKNPIPKLNPETYRKSILN